jgi:rubredoxin
MRNTVSRRERLFFLKSSGSSTWRTLLAGLVYTPGKGDQLEVNNIQDQTCPPPNLFATLPTPWACAVATQPTEWVINIMII